MSALGEQGSSKKAKKHGKQYRSIESDDEQEKWSGGVVPTRNNVRTCCKGTCILQLFQVYSGFLLIFVLLSTLLYPVTVGAYLPYTEWSLTTFFHSLLGCLCIGSLLLTTFTEPGILAQNSMVDPIIPKTKESEELIPFRTISRKDADKLLPGVSHAPQLRDSSTTGIWTMHQNEDYSNWNGVYRYWAVSRTYTDYLEYVELKQQELIGNQDCGRESRTPSHIEGIKREDIIPLRLCCTCNLLIYPQVAHSGARIGHCINGFDHYCCWTGSVIGQRNYAPYVAFLGVLTLFTASGIAIASLVASCRQSSCGPANGSITHHGQYFIMEKSTHEIATLVGGLLHLLVFMAVFSMGLLHLYLRLKNLTQSQYMSLDKIRKKFAQARYACKFRGQSFVQGYLEHDIIRVNDVRTIILEQTSTAEDLKNQLSASNTKPLTLEGDYA